MKRYFWLIFLAILGLAIAVRFGGLTSFPPSLYWEEAALGYDAYSILKTGKDVHGHFLPVVAFESFGDYKPSFYFYSLVPSIALFGLTDFAVRFPSALSGVLLIVVVGFIARELGLSFTKSENSEKSRRLQLLAMFVTAINPWAIQFSRGGWEVNLATFLLTTGMWLQLLIRKTVLTHKKLNFKKLVPLILISVVLCVLSMYTYHSTRVIAPLLLLSVWGVTTIELWIREKSLRKMLVFFVSGVFFLVISLPLLLSLTSSQTQQRFAETSLFADGRQVKLSNQLIELSEPKWLGKLLYHRYIISAQFIVENYLLHFSPSFLFLSGDKNPRHSTQFVGLFYGVEIVFLLSGLYYLFFKRNTTILLLGLWLIIAILPASFTTATPHALRILPTMPVWIVIIAAGILQLMQWASIPLELSAGYLRIKQKSVFVLVATLFVLGCFYGWEFASYWRFYSKVYPVVYAAEWQYGYKDMVKSVEAFRNQYPDVPVQISREYGRPSMYYWFYTATAPAEVQAEEMTAQKDQSEFLQFKNIVFVDHFDLNKRTLIASGKEKYEEVLKEDKNVSLLHKVTDAKGKIIWMLYSVE